MEIKNKMQASEIFTEFEIKVFEGKKTPQEMKAILESDFTIFSDSLDESIRQAVPIILKSVWTKTKSKNKLISLIKENESYFLNSYSREEINNLFKSICKNGNDSR